METIRIKGLEIFAYHGVNPEEKENGQKFILDIAMQADISRAAQTDDLNETVNYAAVRKTVNAVFTAQKYDLIERAAQVVCDAILENYPKVQSVTVELKKPEAPINAVFDYVSVEMTREPCMKRVVLGLGTNLGDRRENLRAALAALSHLPKTEVENVSSVWQTAPFDVPDEQQDYWNICVLLKTELSPSAVLGACLGIEAAMGRVREIYHGARCMDLDVLLYEGFTQREKELNVPHPGILERAFVLFPLLELFPEKNAFGFDFADAPGFKDGDDVQRVGAAKEILD